MEISIPLVMLWGTSSINVSAVIPTLYPANPCIFLPLASSSLLILQISLLALFLGEKASEPLLGLCLAGIFVKT
jgi:hypothetical protein